MIKRALILTHRWLGIVGCAFFAMWFFSGVVLMYVGFPNLTAVERLDRLPPLNVDKINLNAAQAWSHTGLSGQPKRVRLNQPADRPIFHFLSEAGYWTSVFADTGARVQPTVSTDIHNSASKFLPSEGPTIRELVALDQWSVSSSLNAHRPLYVVDMNDASDTQLYVSSRTTEVVRDTTRTERGWNWIGAVLHWIYPIQLRRHPSLWHDVVVWISVPATLCALSGMVIGVWRYRWVGQFKSGQKTPYRGWLRWHHWLGLLFALTTLTWIFSGLMSMNPWNMFSSRTPDPSQLAAWRGGPLQLAAPGLRPALALKGDAREVEWVSVAGKAYFHVASTWSSSLMVAANEAPTTAVERLPTAMLGALAATLMPTETQPTLQWLDEYDLYYYARHQPKRLPMLRARFNDQRATWFHIDPATGTILERIDRSNRVQRWIYNGLHSWDFRLLWDRRPLWDVLLIIFSLGGFALSVTSVVIGWRRLPSKLRWREGGLKGRPSAGATLPGEPDSRGALL